MANEDKRIIELPASTSILNDDWIAKDSASQDTTRLQLSFLKQLCGGNNFAGEWHSGITYTKDSYVTHEGKLYHNIKGTSVVAVDWSSSQWEQVSIGNELRKIVESLAPTFDTSTNYSVDDLVVYNNTLYRCIAAHTAGTWISSHFAIVKVSSLLLYAIMDNFTDIYWEDYSGSPVNYTKGTVIHKGLKLYRCKANTTNQSWDNSKWELVDVTDLLATEHGYMQSLISSIAPTFSSSAQYGINDFVIYNYQLYICTKPHHGSWYSPDFSPAKIGEVLEGIFHDIADVYNPSNSYVKGDVVNYLGIPLKCIVDTATSPMVFSEWEQVTVAQLIDEKVADVQIAGQTTVDENHISDLTSLAIEGTASGEIATFNDGSNLPMRSFICNITANQDLHGYDAPWVGGAGKNKLPMTVDGIKAANTGGTWNGNSYTANGVTFKIQTDNNSNVIGITVDTNGGTASADVIFYLSADSNKGFSLLQGTSYIVTADGATNGVGVRIGDSTDAYVGVAKTNPLTFTADSSNTARIGVNNGLSISNVTIKPMIRLATETDPTFAPYSNICPISGHTGVDAWVRGINLCDEDFETGGVKNNDGTNTSSTTRIRTKNYIRICPNTSYYGYYGDSTIKMYAFYYDENKTYIGTQGVLIDDRVFTTPENAYYMRISTYTNASPEPSTYDGVYHNNISINYPSTDTDYHAYNPNSQTIQVSWQTEAGEVFDGYVDLVSGVLTVDRMGVTYSDTNKKRDDGSFRLYPAPSNALVTNVDNEQPSPLFICNKFKFMSIFEVITTSAVNVGIGISKTSNGFYIKDTAMLQMTLEEAQTYLSTHPIDVVYPLATPITYQLTPQQIKSLVNDVTNVWASTGNVNVKYNKDATTVINSLIARIEALENS